MLKVRVMPTLLYRDFNLVKGVAFDSWRPIGTPMQSVKVYALREVDELVFLDIAATSRGSGPDLALIDELADECQMPITVGGGISRWSHVQDLLRVGADKVSMNTAAVRDPGLIEEASRRFGSQCVVVSIDARREEDATHQVYTHSGKQPTGLHPVEVARRAESAGAGELLITSIDRDGTMTGYDLDLIRSITAAVAIPVIASGGAGSYEDFLTAIEADAAAVAAGTLFNFTQATPKEAKRFLHERGVQVRI